MRYCFLLILGVSCINRGNIEVIDLDKKVTKWYSGDTLIKIKEISKKTGTGVYKFYYPDGTLQKVQEFIDDTIEQGTYKYYYPNGVLQDSAQLTYGKFHGYRYEYYENSKPQTVTNYISNKFRNSVDYRIDGSLKYYRAYSYHEEVMFMVYFDESGKYFKYGGHPIYNFILEKKYPLDEEFNMELLVGNPPNFETSVQVSLIDKMGKEVKSILLTEPDKFNRVIYSMKQNSYEDLHFLNVATLVNQKEGIVLKDTLIITIGKDGVSSYKRADNVIKLVKN